MPDIAQRLAAVRAELGRSDGWLVGGTVRDLVTGRDTRDWDVLVNGDPGDAARAYARRSGSAVFPLSERHGAWRVHASQRIVDFTGLNGSLAADLHRRDFTINAVAISIADATIHDPLGGLNALERRQLRHVSDTIFSDDPLRLLRLVRLAAELDFGVDADTATLATRQAALASRAAGERQFAELQRILATPDPTSALRQLDHLGVLEAVLPELTALRGVAQNDYHHLDVFGHTLHVVDSTLDIAHHPEHYFPDPASSDALRRALDERLDGSLTVMDGVAWAALFHDIAKPQTRHVTDDGSVKFFGHEQAGAQMLVAAVTRFNASVALRRFCQILVGNHLALGFLVREQPLSRRSAYRYALRTRPYPLASIILSLGDRLATRGDRTRLRGVRRHHHLAQEMATSVVAMGQVPPRLVIPGDELAGMVGIEPGPRLGGLVAALQEEQAVAGVRTAGEAVAFARVWLANEPA